MTPQGPDVVFLGPSLTHAEARTIYPDAVILPPAAAGDVMSAAARYKPHAIALIDGAFMQNLATYHKELIDVMARGIWVIGSSSMGAMRAAECGVYGMIGVGQVYAGFASGEIDDDDEVALCHMAAEFEFRPVSEAMVNIRATMAAAVVAQVLSQQEADVLIDCQKARWFMNRRPLASVEDAATQFGLDSARIDKLSTYLREQWVDVKAADARLALARIQELPAGSIPEADRPTLFTSGVYGRLVEHDKTVGYEENLPVTRDQIWRYFVLTDARAPGIANETILRTATVALMRDAGAELTEADLHSGRESLAADLGVAPDELLAHADKIDLPQILMRDWIEEEAFLIKLVKWGQGRRLGLGILDSRLRELARLGEYDSTKRTAGLVESMAQGSAHYENALRLRTALKLQSTISGNPLPEDAHDLDVFIQQTGLGNRGELHERLATLIAAHRELFDLPPIEMVPSDQEIKFDLEPQTSRGR